MQPSMNTNLNYMQDWTVICDFDGTITPFDVSDAIFERFAAASWQDIEQDWQTGRITAKECMQRQVELIATSPNELDAFLDTIPIREGFQDFAAFCQAKARSLIVVSDGMDYPIRRILFRHGLEHLPVISNRLLFKNNQYRLGFPYSAPGCPAGVCKCSVSSALNGPVMLIGDGHSDCCVAKTAELVFAFKGKELERTCRREQYNYLPFTDFVTVRSIVAGLFEPPAQLVHNFK